MQGVLINVVEKVELVCQIGSKDIEKQNTKLDTYQKESIDKNIVYVSDIKSDKIVNVYGKDGQLELVYVDNTCERFVEKVKNKIDARTKSRKESFLKKCFLEVKRLLKIFLVIK